MRNDKILAIKLRRQQKSYNEISKSLGIPKSTLSGWFKNEPNSQNTKLKLTGIAAKRNGERLGALSKLRWEQWRENARDEAKKEFVNLKKNPLFIAGTMLYWAEGDNKFKSHFRFTNTDHRMIALYLKFLTNLVKVKKEDVRIGLILYPDLSEKQCINFWSKITNIPRRQFYKVQFIKGKHPTKRLSHGICMVMGGNQQIKERMMVWIDLLSKIL